MDGEGMRWCAIGKEERAINISDTIIKHYLKDVYFLTGTAYAGKSTMAAMLAERYGLIHCGENYHIEISDQIAGPEEFPNLCYLKTMSGWQEFINRTPEEYERWIYDTAAEAAEFEIAELIRLSGKGKVIVDTNIPVTQLHKIADYHQVAAMLSPQSMSVEHFFDRDDPEKAFINEQINKAEDPEKTRKNYKECIARINSREHYEEYQNSGFFTLVREDVTKDTREETLKRLAEHFGLTEK